MLLMSLLAQSATQQTDITYILLNESFHIRTEDIRGYGTSGGEDDLHV